MSEASGAVPSAAVAEKGETSFGIGILARGKPGEPGGMVVGGWVIAGIAILVDEALPPAIGVRVADKVCLQGRAVGDTRFSPRGKRKE